MEHRRDVPGGDMRACTACGSCRGTKSASSSQGVWTFARDGTEDAAVRGATQLLAIAADQATQAWPILSVTDVILEGDKLRSANQRHTAKRIGIAPDAQH